MRLFRVLFSVLIIVLISTALSEDVATDTDLQELTQFEHSIQSCGLLTLEWNDNGWTVVGCSDKGIVELVIPDQACGIAVTAIGGHAFAGCDQLRLVTIPSTITYIDASAFIDCPNVRIQAPKNSYAWRYAKEHGLLSTETSVNDRMNHTVSTDIIHLATVTDLDDLQINTEATTPTDLAPKSETGHWTIEYNLNGGVNAPVNPDQYEQGTEFIFDEPTRAGYTFSGWYKDAKLKVKITQITAATTGNLSVYAKWAPIQYTVTFYGNNAVNVSSYSQTLTYDKKTALSKNKYKRDQYEFAGWNTAQDGSGESYPDGVKVMNLSPEAGSSVNLYAQWSLKHYKIEYQLNGGTNHPANPASYSYLDTVAFYAPERKDYSFAGWYSDSSFKHQITGIESGSTGKRKIYAKWEHDSYTIFYHSNTEDDQKYTQTALCGNKLSLKSNAFKRDGYSFVGWNTKQDGTGTSLSNGTTVKKPEYERDETVDLYAQWKPVNYTIRYVMNGGTNNSKNPSTYKTTDTITLQDPIRKGCRFCGWYKESSFKTRIMELPAGSTGSITLYAQWIPFSYDVIFNGNGAENISSYSQMIACGSKTYLTSNRFTRDGYTFTSWNMQPDGSGRSYTDRQKIIDGPNEDGAVLQLYAQWQPNLKVISYLGVDFKVVAAGTDVVAFSKLTQGKVCQMVDNTLYKGACLSVAQYYAGAIITKQTSLNLKDSLKYKCFGCSFKPEQYTTEEAMMKRLYTCLNRGKPQILMVSTEKNTRHFVTVVGYKASVENATSLRAVDLLIIDSYDGKLESMDPVIYPKDGRVIFAQNGKYRIDVAW